MSHTINAINSALGRLYDRPVELNFELASREQRGLKEQQNFAERIRAVSSSYTILQLSSLHSIRVVSTDRFSECTYRAPKITRRIEMKGIDDAKRNAKTSLARVIFLRGCKNSSLLCPPPK